MTKEKLAELFVRVVSARVSGKKGIKEIAKEENLSEEKVSHILDYFKITKVSK
jgi:hypothetical protein